MNILVLNRIIGNHTITIICIKQEFLIPQDCRGARGVMVIVVGNGHGDASCISHSTNTLAKGMNPILPPAMGKQQGRLRSSGLVRQLVQEKENSEFKPVKLRLKIDLMSYPARAEGLGKYDNKQLARLSFFAVMFFGLVSLFNGISTFVGYLMRKPFFWKNSSGTI